MKALILFWLLFAIILWIFHLESADQRVSVGHNSLFDAGMICEDITITSEEWPEEHLLNRDSDSGSGSVQEGAVTEPEATGLESENSLIPVYRTVNIELLNRVSPELIIFLKAF